MPSCPDCDNCFQDCRVSMSVLWLLAAAHHSHGHPALFGSPDSNFARSEKSAEQATAHSSPQSDIRLMPEPEIVKIDSINFPQFWNCSYDREHSVEHSIRPTLLWVLFGKGEEGNAAQALLCLGWNVCSLGPAGCQMGMPSAGIIGCEEEMTSAGTCWVWGREVPGCR